LKGKLKMGWIKSSAGASIAVLALGVTGLAIMVWLSPSDDKLGIPTDVHKISGASTNSSVVPMGANAASAPMQSGTDPFKAQLEKQAANPKNMVTEKPQSAMPLGVDIFKEKLAQQAKQAKEASASPFGNTPSKP
jgi:hypothetical protein